MLVAQFGATGFLWILDVLDFVLCGLAAEVDGFVIEIVNSANVANSLTTSAHQYGMSDRCPSDQFHSRQQGPRVICLASEPIWSSKKRCINWPSLFKFQFAFS